MLSEIFKLFWKTVERKDARRINSQTPPTEIEQFCDIQYIDDGYGSTDLMFTLNPVSSHIVLS